MRKTLWFAPVLLLLGCPQAEVCDALTCSSGCCDAKGACQPGDLSYACGQAGHACSSCLPSQICAAAQCIAAPPSGTGGGLGTGGGSGGSTGGGTGGAGGGTGFCASPTTIGSCTGTDVYCNSTACCPAGYPYTCNVTKLCYSSASQASAACGASACDHCVTAAKCGDGVCNGNETSATCCSDCPCSGSATCDHASNACVGAVHQVDCNVSVVRAEWCRCTAKDTNTGTTTYAGGCKSDTSFAPMTCCQASTFPASGNCSCWLSRAWACNQFGATTCACSNYWDPAVQMTTTCDNVTDPGGHPWRCCAIAGSCTCTQNGAACGAGYKEVSNCTNYAALGLQPAVSTCPTGQLTVSSCH